MDNNSHSEEKIIAAISYVWLLFLVPLILKKDNSFCQFHAKQGLVLFFFSLLVLFFGALPLIGWLIIAPLGWLVIIIFSVLGFLNALQGKEWEMPYLSKYAKRINL
ncbi:MAG TPA: hypothetical protein PKZ16_02235 [bacterium]|nr:hypothetical protein [bacterium]HPL95566.1 hypothetical protein [bacterium]